MTWVYQTKEMPDRILEHPAAKRFVSETATVLNEAMDYAIRETQMSDLMASRLRDSNYVFSGIKTFHELNEAFPALLDESGNVKPFKSFLNDVQKIHEAYNENYLRTEYNFARASSLMAGRWESFDQTGKRYNLQYRTAGDDRVRQSHQLLNRVTLPITSKFWDKYFPPNGWGCRCTVVQVLKKDYPESDEAQALSDGSKATFGKHQEMFEFNPGKQQATFPAYNAYTIKGCTSCQNNLLKLAAQIPKNDLCRTCKIVTAMAADWRQKKEMPLKEADREIRRWLDKKGPHTVSGNALTTGRLRINSQAVKRYLGHAKSAEAKWILTTLPDNIDLLENPSFTAIGDGKDRSDRQVRKNIAEKRNRAVTGYYRYDYQYNGVTWVIGTERVEKTGVFEQPYFIAKKKP